MKSDDPDIILMLYQTNDAVFKLFDEFITLFQDIIRVQIAYNRAYKSNYARYLKEKMTTARFEQWSRYALELREQAEYERLLKICKSKSCASSKLESNAFLCI